MPLVSTWIILNPTAGSGRAATIGRRLQQTLGDAELQETSRPGDATRLARQARSEGVKTVVAVGGDGTIHECVTGLTLEEDGSTADCATRLALAPAGTGGDYRKTFGFSESVEQAQARIRDPEIQRIDVGRATFETSRGSQTVAFANVLSFGLGGLTDQLVERGPKWMGGKAAFFLGALQASLAHQPIPIELRLDDRVIEIAPYSNVAICCGQYFGGGMQIAPDADPSDGLFDVVTMELSKLEALTLAASIYRGTHLARERVNHYRCSRLEAKPTRDGESLIDVDGEQLGRLPLSVEVLPGALELLT